MPREDGTGPSGEGPGTGRGLGRGGGRGRMGGGGLGPRGFCICNKCGYRIEHLVGTQCMDMKCPKCNIPLVRESSYHDRRTHE